MRLAIGSCSSECGLWQSPAHPRRPRQAASGCGAAASGWNHVPTSPGLGRPGPGLCPGPAQRPEARAPGLHCAEPGAAETAALRGGDAAKHGGIMSMQ